MKLFLPFFFLASVWAQTAATPPAAPPDLPPDTVVATFGDGHKLTAGEIDAYLKGLPPNQQRSALRDRRAFVEQFALMHRLAEMAEQAKLDQLSPTREALAFSRMYVLMNAQLREVMDGINISAADEKDYYEKNKDQFKQVKVKAIYIPFSSAAGDGKHLTEAEAQAKITKLRSEILGGADFVKLVKENSADQTSVARDGDFGTIRRTDNLPEAIRTAIFSLKVGEVSQPVRQPSGFYLFRAEEIGAEPFAEIREQIVGELKQARFKQWMDDTVSHLNLKIENQSYFAPNEPAVGGN